MTDKKDNETPSLKKFVFNVDYKGVANTDITIVAETLAQARQKLRELYPDATISFLRESIQ